MAKKKRKERPGYIWNTYGDWCATLVDGHIWDLRGNWIGWIDENRDVYKADGEWIGTLSRDMRILRKRTARSRALQEHIPETPPKPELPARATLPPSFAELTYSEIDVLEEDPQAFQRISDLKKDMD
ncbi:MAG: hypothetical protein GYB64_03025 [Chloroflexi bacterium]|nr:hypothetical protein [Chloroflexota bacterium]